MYACKYVKYTYITYVCLQVCEVHIHHLCIAIHTQQYALQRSVCVYVCMYVYMYSFVNVYLARKTCMLTCMDARTHVYVHVIYTILWMLTIALLVLLLTENVAPKAVRSRRTGAL